GAGRLGTTVERLDVPGLVVGRSRLPDRGDGRARQTALVRGRGRMRKRMLGAIAVAAVLAIVMGACAKSSPGAGGTSATGGVSGSPTQKALTTLTPGTLLVGSCLDYKPFEYYEGGNLKGFDG